MKVADIGSVPVPPTKISSVNTTHWNSKSCFPNSISSGQTRDKQSWEHAPKHFQRSTGAAHRYYHCVYHTIAYTNHSEPPQCLEWRV